MAKLRLSVIPNDKPVKVALELPATVHRDLVVYAEILARESNQPINDPVKLIAPCWRALCGQTGLLLRLAAPPNIRRRRTGRARGVVVGASQFQLFLMRSRRATCLARTARKVASRSERGRRGASPPTAQPDGRMHTRSGARDSWEPMVWYAAGFRAAIFGMMGPSISLCLRRARFLRNLSTIQAARWGDRKIIVDQITANDPKTANTDAISIDALT